MATVEPPINTSVIIKVYLRPIISPILPNTNAPNGRTTRPAEKVANVARKAATGFSFGKNCVEIIVAKLPKIKKSYHSMIVPTEDAAMIEIRLLLEGLVGFNCFILLR